MELKQKLIDRLKQIYKKNIDPELIEHILIQIEQTKEYINTIPQKWSENDILLITYGDSIKTEDEQPLKSLHDFVQSFLKEYITFIHILPFFPYSSDDGFSVIDYKQVNPDLGSWKDIELLSANYHLMFDLVINHISQYSKWFQNYLKQVDPGKSYFIETEPSSDLSKVVRPRSLPLLSPVKTISGIKHVWTTFSSDQIDLNFTNPNLLIEMLEIFLLYFRKGAKMIRLDAIAFLWKKIGTNCLHLPETHEIVKLMRDIVDYLNPGLILLTETNVPNNENLSYFGNNDEAHMVYQFSLPPLLLYSFYTGKSDYLTNWAANIPELDENCTFFNFTASHDGIGVRPLEGLIPKQEFDNLIKGICQYGAKISTKTNTDGTNSPYEINISFFDAMMGTNAGKDQFQEDRFICSQTIMMAMKGLPAFYIHSLLATHNYSEGVKKTGANRAINRKKWDKKYLYKLLSENTEHSRVLNRLKEIIMLRKQEKSFHPNASQQVIYIDKGLFVIIRDNYRLVSISNITMNNLQVDLHNIYKSNHAIVDLLTGKNYSESDRYISISPYQTAWLKK